jgi:predicted aminopeptidase
VDRDGRGLVQVVTAAPPDRLEPVTWWFPIVGRVSYRGYFEAERARRFADSLEEKGLDTYVRPGRLYSTLGWFDDPVPRELLRGPPFEVADTVLHERVHETIFVADDSMYNEGIAVFVSHAAVLRLYAEEPRTKEAAAGAFRDEERFARLLAELADELETLYDRDLPMETLLRERDTIFARYRTSRFDAVEWETSRYRAFPRVRLSNAYVVARRTYLGDLPCFAAELESRDGDLEAFVRAHRERPGRRSNDDGSCPFAGARGL